MAWGATGAFAAALAGGAAFWMAGDEPGTAHVAPVVVAAAGVTPARAAAPEPAPVPAATIHDEPAPAAAKPAADDLRNALEEGTTAKKAPAKEAKPAKNDLRDALEEGTAVKPAPAPKPAASTKAVAKAAAKPAPKSTPKPAPVVRKTPARSNHDSDLALLSALVAHTQSSRAPDANRALKKELQACSRLKGSKARDCREEACLGQDRSVAMCK